MAVLLAAAVLALLAGGAAAESADLYAVQCAKVRCLALSCRLGSGEHEVEERIYPSVLLSFRRGRGDDWLTVVVVAWPWPWPGPLACINMRAR